MISTIVIAVIAFLVGAFWAKASADKFGKFLVAEQKRQDDFYTGFIVNAGLRSVYSLAWRHLMTLNHHAADLRTEIKYRATFQDKDDLSGAIEKAEDFISCNKDAIEDIQREIAYFVEEAKKDLTEEECNVVGYLKEWIQKYNDNVAVLKHLVKEHS